MKSVLAVEFDQQSAHPHAAATIEMPSSDSLYAGFDFSRNESRFLWQGSKRFEREISRPGLFYLKLYGRPAHLDSGLCPPQWRRDGFYFDFITSNEIEWLGKLNISIDGIVARWTSTTIDDGIKRYAEHALDEINSASGFRRAIIKAMFLAGLGVLGAKPHQIKILRGHEMADGDLLTIPTRTGKLSFYRKEMKRTYQLAIANLIQRTMIERECAKRSWQFAQWLSDRQWKPICVYADSVFATPPKAQMELVDLPAPWREKGVHTNLQFKTATTYVSDQASKMPGVPLFGGGERLRAREVWAAEKVARSDKPLYNGAVSDRLTERNS